MRADASESPKAKFRGITSPPISLKSNPFVSQLVLSNNNTSDTINAVTPNLTEESTGSHHTHSFPPQSFVWLLECSKGQTHIINTHTSQPVIQPSLRSDLLSRTPSSTILTILNSCYHMFLLSVQRQNIKTQVWGDWHVSACAKYTRWYYLQNVTLFLSLSV